MEHLETGAVLDKKDNRLLLRQNRRHRQTERNLQAQKRKSFKNRGRIACRNFLRRKCTNPSCNLWHPPLCVSHKSGSGCTNGEKCHFRHVEAEGKTSKRAKKGGAKGSVAILKESTQWCCVSQDSYPRKSILHEPGKLGSNHTVKFSKGTWHHIKISGKKGSIARKNSKV